ncbi:MAG: helix-turn-helix domain-containing protein [Turicibacter sp.]|nr:helix-turn-helix domain-containing protein [Turicibacter sp.]
MECIGERLARIRKEKGLSQEELAHRLHVTRQAISNWERQKTEPDLETLIKIADVFEKDIDELLGRDQLKKDLIDFRGLKWVHWFNILIVMGYVVFIIVSPLYSLTSGVTLLVILLMAETTLYLMIPYVIKTGDYTLMAGYNHKVRYHYPMLNRMLYLMALSWSVMTAIFLFILISMMLIKIEESWLMSFLIVLYCVQGFLTILLIEGKYHHRILIDVSDQEIFKLERWILGGFGFLILLLVITLVVTMGVFEIHNNTFEALKLILFVIPYLVLSIGSLFFEQSRIRNIITLQQPYRIHYFTYLAVSLCFVLLGGIIFTGYQLT